MHTKPNTPCIHIIINSQWNGVEEKKKKNEHQEEKTDEKDDNEQVWRKKEAEENEGRGAIRWGEQSRENLEVRNIRQHNEHNNIIFVTFVFVWRSFRNIHTPFEMKGF